MFCFSALSWISFCAAGDSVATRLTVRAGSFLAQRQLAHLTADQVLGTRPCFGVAELDLDRGRGLADARVPDVLFAQQRADVGGEGLEPLVDGGAHVDLQQEVHAAAQVEPEIHRQRVQAFSQAGVLEIKFSATT